MNTQRYVRHFSGKGGPWMLNDNSTYNSEVHADWCVHRSVYGALFLPKSEYILCDPPPLVERWEDVTSDCETFEDDGFSGVSHERISRFQSTSYAGNYRIRKLEHIQFGWAFVVERKMQP